MMHFGNGDKPNTVKLCLGMKANIFGLSFCGLDPLLTTACGIGFYSTLICKFSMEHTEPFCHAKLTSEFR